MSWYTRLAGDLVLHTRAKYGFLGTYDRTLGVTIFERFYLGGDGLSGYGNLDGREIIGMRGYSNESLTPEYYRTQPLVAPSTPSTHGDAVTGFSQSQCHHLPDGFPGSRQCLVDFNQFNPFDVKRSAGAGVEGLSAHVRDPRS